MWSLFGAAKPRAPPTVDSDTIIPLSVDDDTNVNRRLHFNMMMRFDDVLDPEKLRGSLEKLLGRGDWRKLGARLRLDSEGKLEYHVPERFDEDRRAFAYSHVPYEIQIAEHPTASRIPSGASSDNPAIVQNSQKFQSLAGPTDAPTKMDDYIYSDRPLLGLHIVSFTDSTLVSLSWLHILWDAMGRRQFMLAWTAVLDGRDNDVPPIHGFDTYPLESLGKNPTEPFKLNSHRLGVAPSIFFGLRRAWEERWYSKETTRIVCIPAPYMKTLRETALAELREGTAEGDSTVQPFVSDGDLLAAWITRLVATYTPFKPNQNICVLNAFGWRSLIKDLLPPPAVFLGNAWSGVLSLTSTADVMTRPLSHTASVIRQTMAELCTRPQLEAFVGIYREAFAKAGYPPLFGDCGMQLVVMSNWSKARFYDMDFSSAVVMPGTSEVTGGARGTGKPRYIHPYGCMSGPSARGTFQISGKDGDGNYWVSGLLREETWDKVEKAFDLESE